MYNTIEHLNGISFTRINATTVLQHRYGDMALHATSDGLEWVVGLDS